jgi:hypothetical protein
MRFISAFIAFSLAGIMLLNIIHVPLTYAYYYLDQSGFIELLCENKEELEMECNGKCHLKKISQNNTERSDTPIPVILEKEIILFIQNTANDTIFKLIQERSIFDHYLTHYSYTETYNLFHPPQV